jgi:hypothetical protein
MRAAFLVVVGTLCAQTDGLKLTNCTRLQIPGVMAGRSATTVSDSGDTRTGHSYAVFAVNSHASAPVASIVNIFNATSKVPYLIRLL